MLVLQATQVTTTAGKAIPDVAVLMSLVLKEAGGTMQIPGYSQSTVLQPG